MKIRPMRVEGLTNRQPNMTELLVAFRSSAKAPKNLLFPYKAGRFWNIGTTVSMMIQVCWHVTMSTGTVPSKYWLCPTEQLSGMTRIALHEAFCPTEVFFGGWLWLSWWIIVRTLFPGENMPNSWRCLEAVSAWLEVLDSVHQHCCWYSISVSFSHVFLV